MPCEINSGRHDPPPDPHDDYTAAVRDWVQADSEHHRAMVGVMFGDDSAAEGLKAAAARLEWATDTALIEKHRVGRRWFDGFRLCTEDDELKLAVKLHVIEQFRPAVEGLLKQVEHLTARVDELKAQVADIEDTIAEGVPQ